MRLSPALLFQRLAPLSLLTRSAGPLAQCRHPWVAQPLIRAFIRRHRIDLDEALHSSPRAYRCFNDFFSRALRPDARPLAAADWTSPVDGTISQLGRIQQGRMIQAKQQAFSAAQLLADAELAQGLDGGSYTTVYLNPRDYHRVHMPCEGRLLGMRHVPGTHYSVRPDIVQGIDGLLARNERLVCWFEHPRFGRFAMVLVGAAIVGSIATVWHGVVSRPRHASIRHWDYAAHPALHLRQGQEMGHFQLGSTVVLLMPNALWDIDPAWRVGRQVRLGQALAGSADWRTEKAA
ncbi:archaetidylserine decarboxylase [Achromobacter sp. UMC46]|uniref:archaetidylserine decarboxylase n=1 Tax=Achromobacter sp. UMC46 TaxID=1862319 RepID=UPI0016012C58|nr:archaetidylserine decarboxylase [Achromobacter sp. UMC46]MBB1596885.1 phosphatidylserine decarboxylase [Achromobacter sp. UMC46]